MHRKKKKRGMNMTFFFYAYERDDEKKRKNALRYLLYRMNYMRKEKEKRLSKEKLYRRETSGN
jgi:hypothetical protein